MSPLPVIFVHIPKTAGSTLGTILRKQYTQNRMFATRAMSRSALQEQQRDIVRSIEENRILAMSGHMVFGAHRHTDRPFQYITIVREPIDRVISDYYYVRRTPTHDFYDPVVTQDYSLEDYVTRQITIYTDNVQTRMLAGVGTDVPIGECTKTMLNTALEHVENHFVVAGLTSRFDESIILMKQMLNWGYPLYMTRNKTRKRPSWQDVSAETRAVIREHNQLDVVLYEHIQEQFQSQIDARDATFDHDLRRLQQLNKLYSPCVRAYIQLRKGFNTMFGRDQW